MFPTFISILDIQSWWEVPSIAHFCSLFRTAFNLLDFDIEDLEEALLTDGTEESSWLQELIVLLLKGCLPNNAISLFNYQMFLRRLFRHKCLEHNIINPFNTDIDFQLLPLRVKVEILHFLCDFRLESGDVIDQLKNLEADSLRVEPLGYDSNHSAYWYFYGTRLYREDNPKSKSPVWQVICFTLNDWEQLVEKLKKSKRSSEIQLYQTLQENFIPELPRLFREKENLARKRLLERLPRRSSSRLKVKGEEDEKYKNEKCESIEIYQQVIEETKQEDLRSLRNKRREELSKQKEASSAESQSDHSEFRYEMAGGKTKDKKNKGRHLKDSNTDGGGRSKSSSNVPDKKKEVDVKPVGRQTNNSLASATGQILIQPVSNPHRKKLKTSQVFSQSDEDLETGLHKILNHVKNHDDAWPFIEPVEEEYAPNYYSIIRKPMDLQRMEERLDSGHYKSFSKFKTDFQLIVNNCRLYNGIDNEYTEMVDNLLEVFNRAVERYLDQITSSDEEIAVEYSDADKEKSNKRKRTESSSSALPSKRKPTLAAQTDKKKERSPSVESLVHESDEDLKKNKKTSKKEEPIKNNKKDKSKISKESKTSKKHDVEEMEEMVLKKPKDEDKHNKKHKGEEKIKGKSQKNIPDKEEIGKTKKQKQATEKEEVKSKKMKNKIEKTSLKHQKYSSDEEEILKSCKKKIISEEIMKNKKSNSTKDETIKNKKQKNKINDEKMKHKKHKDYSDDEDVCSEDDDIIINKKQKASDLSKKHKKDEKKHKKPEEKNKKVETKKQHKSALPEKKKPGRKPKAKAVTPTHKRSNISRSPSRDRWSSSPPPSWPPSSPENTPKKINKNTFHSSDEDQMDSKGKHKPKHDKWKEIFKEDTTDSKRESTPTPPKHKDKHNKLRETIEKLKAKSDLTKLKEKDLKVFDFESEKCKENQDITKTDNKNKSQDVKKKTIKMKKDDYEDENSTGDSLQSENKGKNSKKCVNSKNSGTKNAAIEALTLATEQTLKDINKWLDDTPRFPEFSSASNSPSHFSAIDDFDSLSNKTDADKKKADKPVMQKKDAIKDLKKRSFQRDPTKLFRRREVQRTIDRLQPGKSKGNLITNVQNTTKPDELFLLGPLSKIKDTKNSLIVKTDESAPKLSLGSVLDSFGKHKFVDDELKKEEETKPEIVEEKETKTKLEVDVKKELPVKKEESIVEIPKLDNSPGQATPNLSAWFKAFGAPKVQQPVKKVETKEEKPEVSEVKKEDTTSKNKVPTPEPSPNADSPVLQGQPISRQRKISTGSSMSERSSFSQDMDSPRVGIDERLGAYPAPYPSPLHKSPTGASPNLRSPLPDVSPKSTSYPFNGQIRVGFYQDTVSTKSSPDKSCSPRDNPQSPYTQYSEHVYTPPTSQNVYSYNNPYYSQPPNYSSSNPTPPYNSEQSNPPSYYDTNKPLTDQYQVKNNATSPVNICTANSPVAPQQPSPSINQQHSPSIDNFKQTQPAPNIEVYNQQNSPIIESFTPNQQINADTYRPTEISKYQNQQQTPAVDKFRQHTQEDFNKLNIPPANLDVYNPQLSSPSVDNTYRPQTNLESYRQQQQNQQQQQTQQLQPQQQQSQNIEAFRPDIQLREKTVPQPAASFPVKKRAYNEVDQTNKFDEPYKDLGLLSNRMTAEQIRDNPKYVHQNIPEPRTLNTQQNLQPINQEANPLTMRNVNFSSNPYNYNEPYSLNIPTASRNVDGERKVDMSKFTNMGYTGPEMNFPRNPPQYNKPNVPSTANTDQCNSQRFAENMNIAGFKPTQSSHIANTNVPETTTNANNRLENPVTRMDNYKSEVTIPRPTYSGNIANLSHIVDRFQNDDRMLSGLQSSAPSYFADKNISSQHMFSKPIATSTSGLPMFSQPNTMPYSHNIQSTSSMYNRPMSELQNSTMHSQDRTSLQQQMQEKKSKRRKTTKTATPPVSTMDGATNPAPTQGFQSYTGLKNPTSMEPSAISLKTASVVPGSAFNFGPTATGLGLGTGLYGDKDAYPNFLEDFRSAAPNYYITSAAAAHHRSTPENSEKPVRAAHQSSNPQASSYPFIGAPQPRPSYQLGAPFMPPHQTGLMDPSSPLYQPYLQAGVLHQGLLGPPVAYPPGYHPALSMRQPYETMTRPSWL